MHNTSIRVLIADDHRIVREGLRQVMADAPDIQVRAEAASGDEALQAVFAVLQRGLVPQVIHQRREPVAFLLQRGVASQHAQRQ